jgi:hypothetical protein
MKKISLIVIAVVAVQIMLNTSSCNNNVAETENKKETPKPEEIVEKGKYLVGIMGCNDCHSPKKMGPNGPEIIPELMLSGYPAKSEIVKFDSKMLSAGFSMFYPDLTAAAGPWGVSFAGNLTPHETGIGNWTEEQFKKALTQGKYKGIDGARTLLPPMPWMNYVNLKDDDLHAMFMYLKSIPAVNNLVPAPIAPDKM